MATTSPELIAEKVAETRATLLRHSDALDAKAGVLLGFSGVFVLLTFSPFSWWRLPGIAAATLAAFACLAVFRPDRALVFEVRMLRRSYLGAEAAFTRRHLIDTEITMIEVQSMLLSSNALWILRSIRLLVLAILLIGIGTLIERIGG